MITQYASADEGLVGFEWTFTNSDLVKNFRNTPVNPDLPALPGRGLIDQIDVSSNVINSLQNSSISQASNAWIEEIKKDCPSCLFEGRKVHTPDGFWFQITMDQTVLEVITEPMTHKQLLKRSEILDRLVWKAAKRVNLVPHKRLGGGHLHLDIETNFKGDRKLFRNFVVDLVNRPELFMGGFGLNYFNAPPLSFYGSKALKSFSKIISNFDKKENISVSDLMVSINEFYETLSHPVTPTPDAKFQALNFKHFDFGTLEIRGVRPQINVEHAERLVKIFQARIKVLKKQKTLIKVRVPDLSKSYRTTRENGYRFYSHNLTAKQILKSVEAYALDAGLEHDFYNNFVTEELIENLKLEAKTKKASRYKSAGSCGAFL